MAKAKYAQQAKLIRPICESAGLTWEEMADLAALQRESMRKIANGYQPASPQLIQSFRNIARLREREFLSKGFARLLHELKWPASKAVKELELDPEELRRYAEGEEAPAPILLRMLKIRAGEASGGAEGSTMIKLPDVGWTPIREPGGGLEEWESALLTELRRFSEKDRREIARHVRGIIGLLPAKGASHLPGRGE